MKRTDERVHEKFNQIYELYRDSIFSFCMSRLHCNVENAEDCLQETFSVCFRKLKSGEELENPRAFLYKTASNLIKKSQRNESRIIKTENLDDESEIADTSFSVDDELIAAQITERIEAALSPEERLIFEKRFEEGIDVKDIADELGITPGNCAIKLFRIRNRLKQEISEFL